MHNADAIAAEGLAARPTEALLLCSENVSQELRQTRASHEEKQRMLEILQRVHEADAAEQPATGLPGGDAEAADIPEDALSDDTVARLLEQVERSPSCALCACLSLKPSCQGPQTNAAIIVSTHDESEGPCSGCTRGAMRQRRSQGRSGGKHALPRMQAEHVGDLQVALSDLTAGERAAFEAELAAGALARLVLPWEPWWRLPEAQHLSLSAAGTRLLHDLGAPFCLNPRCIRQGTARHCFSEIDLT